MDHILLSDPAARLMGSKAKFLHRATQSGFADLVPFGFVVDPDGEEARATLQTGFPTDFWPVRNTKTYAVRSCAVGEDVPGKSYAGQFESLLDVPASRLGEAVLQVAASASAVNPAPKMFVIVQEMVKTAYSGVCFTVDPEAPDSRMVVNWSQVAHAVTSGGAEAHEFQYFPKTDAVGVRGLFPLKLVPALRQFCRIHAVFGPSDIEWAIDTSYQVKLFQVRSLVSSLRGYGVGRICCVVPVLVSPVGVELDGNLAAVDPDQPVALVVPQTWPEDSRVVEKYKDRIAVLVCDHGSRTSHPMILARELKIPAIVGVQWGTKVLETTQLIKVFAADGEGEIFFL